MSKRKLFQEHDYKYKYDYEYDYEYSSENYESPTKKQKQEKISPIANNIRDLINLGENMVVYENFDILMLWKILPYLQELDSIIGMKSLKETLFFQIIYYLQGLHICNNEEYLHTVIKGPPGVGKTKISKIIGKLYDAMGILSNKGIFKVAYRDDFIAGYLGQTAIKTKKLLESCVGGVLFIDEVYSLAPRDKRDSFSKEALDTLTAFLSENKNNFCCIVAGYEKDIEECFFANNSGLKRRFPWVHKIDSYTSEELTDIFLDMVRKMGWIMTSSKKDIVELIEKNKTLFEFFGGDIETFLSKCKMAHAKRVFNLNIKHKLKLTLEDLEGGIELVKKNKKEEQKQKIPFGMYS